MSNASLPHLLQYRHTGATRASGVAAFLSGRISAGSVQLRRRNQQCRFWSVQRGDTGGQETAGETPAQSGGAALQCGCTGTDGVGNLCTGVEPRTIAQLAGATVRHPLTLAECGFGTGTMDRLGSSTVVGCTGARALAAAVPASVFNSSARPTVTTAAIVICTRVKCPVRDVIKERAD